MNNQISLMMKICLMLSATIISGLLDFTVLKQYVAPCGVVIAWAKFPKSESPTRFCPFWKKYFTQKNQNQITLH